GVVCWLFFFSSRRRHTRFSRDWSSDVCSSDLDCKYRINLAFSVKERFVVGLFVFFFMISSSFSSYSSRSISSNAILIKGGETRFAFKCCLIFIFPHPFIRNFPSANALAKRSSFK